MTDREELIAALARADAAELRATRVGQRAAAAEAQAAEYGLALEVLGQLAGVTSEDAVADVVLEFTQIMFGAENARLTLLDRRQRPTRAWERGISGLLGEVSAPQPEEPCILGEVEVVEGGLRVPIRLGWRVVACLDLNGLALPAERDRYAATVLVLARVTAMALVNLRAMRGLVPICAGCKQIRDDAGRWQPLERWISSHSEADLSHGLCPTCLAEMERDAGLEPVALDAAPAPPDTLAS